MLDNMKKYKIFLASKSPRRRELLQQLRIPFHTISIGGIDETYPKEMPAQDVPQYLSEKKAEAYSQRISEGDMIITADTLVICEDKILGKPATYEEAKDMLTQLSGKTHEVITGVCITTLDRKIAMSTKTEVKFAELSKEDIEYYVETYSPLDKAGAYGIQEWIGCIAVEWIKGSYYNVMGLPVHQLYKELKNF